MFVKVEIRPCNFHEYLLISSDTDLEAGVIVFWANRLWMIVLRHEGLGVEVRIVSESYFVDLGVIFHLEIVICPLLVEQ